MSVLASRLTIFSSLFLFFTIVQTFPTDSVAQAAEPKQRMRIPVGEYWVGGGGGPREGGTKGHGSRGDAGAATAQGGSGGRGGSIALTPFQGNASGGFVLPAFCVDKGRDPPEPDTSISHLSGDVKVHRYRGSKAAGTRSFNEAINGSDPWLKLKGTGSAASLRIVPENDKFSYRIVVSGLALGGEDTNDVELLFKEWTANARLMQASSAFDAMRQTLASGSTTNNPTLGLLELARRQFEWRTFGGARTGAVVPAADFDAASGGRFIDLIMSTGLSISTSELTPADRLDWLALARGKSLGTNELASLARPLLSLGVTLPSEGDPALKDQKLLAAYSQAAMSQGGVFSGFHALRVGQNLPFASSLRQAAFNLGDEVSWTTGQPELRAILQLACFDRLAPEIIARLNERVLETLGSFSELMRNMGSYSETFHRSRLVKLAVSNDSACFMELKRNNKIERRIVPLSSLSSQFFTKNFRGAKFVSEGESAAATLDGLDIKYDRSDAVARVLGAKAFSEQTGAVERRLDHFRRRSGAVPGLDLTVLNLDTRGDALVARAPDGSLLMIDTGIGKDTLAKLSEFLKRNYKTEKPSVRIVITHTDSDHIGGLKEIADAGFEIREVLIGRSLGDRYPLDELANVFAKAKPTDVKTGDNPGITHYFDGVGEPAFRANERRVSGGVESWTLHGIADVQIEVHHVIAARVPNQGGLLVRLGYRGMHWLLSDDLDETAIRTFVRGLGPGSLSAGILKWPHHLWLPGGPADRLILGEFLRRVNPHTIVFSNIGHWSHDKKQFEDIQAFVAEELRGTATTAWTRENEKHIMIRAETEPQRRAYHDAIVSRSGPPQGHASLN